MPAQPTAPARHRRFWQNRNFQGVLLFPVVIALLYWIDGRRGDQAWGEYKAWAVGRGIKLYQSDYERLAIPDEENYAAASFIVEMGNEANSDDVVKRLKLPSLYLRSPTEWKAVRRDPLLGWQKAFVREKWIPSAGDDPAADVLTALERLDGSLSQVRAASQRPMSQWPAQLDEIGRQRFPYLMPLLAATNALNLRSQALLAQHRGEEALAEIRHSLRAARSLEHEETVIPYLLRTTIWNNTLDVAEYGIASGLWDDSELRALPAEWTGIDVLGDLVFALDSQRTMDNAYYEMLATDRARLAKLLAPSGSAPFVKVMAAIFRALPRGSVRIDQVEYNRIIDTDLQDIDAVHSAINPRFSRSINRSRKIVGVTEFCTSTVALTNANTTYKAAATHTRIQQLVVQCALARYRIEHGAFPASLDELVPGFLERIPRDPMDGQPLRYRRADAGGCLVWSVGPNRIDDGGKPNDRPDRSWEGPDWVSVLPSIGTK